MTDVIDAILNRASEPRLIAPAPDRALLDRVLACAARAPDHALLRPWRYLVIEGEGLDALGELFASAADDADQPLGADRDKLRRMPLRAPMMIVGICSPRPHPKVPEIEQMVSAGVGLGYLLLALESAGYGAMWRTGDVAYHPRIRDGLGLDPEERIAGFLYVGTVESRKPAVPRPEVADFVSRWPR
ncbi:MAG: nitroreductase [Marinobacter sp.]|uniref:nitroreductase family protein n=1 Tax=Marinobacter sp. TaxID=50741 RepID=UPI00299E4F94|nr:nitroreductase [Marinobacter sp.]MDX1635613.1 nitroreductase [Marinobacter sp.]